MIRNTSGEDATCILEIYSYYVKTSHCTFELEPPSLDQLQRKIRETKYPWLVFEEKGKVLGYAYATEWKAREAYNHTVETSVYVQKDQFGKGIACKLYSQLLQQLVSSGFHTALAGISLPNEASIRLHEKLGFQKVGQLGEVGFKFNQWVDVGYWQLSFAEGEFS